MHWRMVSRLVDPARGAHRIALRRMSRVLFLLAAATAVLSSWPPASPMRGQEDDGAEGAAQPASDVAAVLIPIPLPIRGAVDTRAAAMIDRALSRFDETAGRPLLIVEFRTSGKEETDKGSQFERSLALARLLSSDKLSRVRTVAYLPRSIRGHAVLAALGCEEIVMHPEAELGEAGVNETFIDPTMRRGYAEIADRRRNLPAAVALGMLDAELTVHAVETESGIQYVLDDELEELKQRASVGARTTIIEPGRMGRFSGLRLRDEFGWISRLASDRLELAHRLGLSSDAIEEDPSLAGDWRPARIALQGAVNSKSVNWVIQGIENALRAERANFICLVIDSPGGNVEQSLRLAHFLADLDSAQVRTVAFIDREARADAALIALACDDVVMSETALLGGPGAAVIGRDDAQAMRPAIRELAKANNLDWSLPAALLDNDLQLRRYTRDGVARYFSRAQLEARDDAAEWTAGDAIETVDGFSGRRALELGVARYAAEEIGELQRIYNMEEEFESLDPGWAQLTVARLASPELTGAMLFLAFFLAMIESISPGLGVPGFASGVCFVLFFWSQYLNGTAEWLEAALFLLGVGCVAMEIFVVPGFGVFGVGGGLLMIASIILATQTFIVPRNLYQWQQVPNSLLIVSAAGGGALAALGMLRRFLPEAPLLKRMMTAPPRGERLKELERRESLSDLAHLMDKRGAATTRLTPAGKVRFGDELVDVVSSGDMIPAGSAVRVKEVLGNRVVVEAIEENHESA